MSELKQAVAEDCSTIVFNFASHGCNNFKPFADEWNRMQFQYVFACLTKQSHAICLTEILLDTTKRMLLTRKPLLERIGSLYLMYTIYCLQPVKLFCKVNLTLENWKAVRDFMELLRKEPDTKEAQYILCKLYLENGFWFVFSDKYVGLERGIRPGEQDQPARIQSHIDKTIENEMVEINHTDSGMLAGMDILEESYNEMKDLLNNTGRSNVCGTLEQSDIVQRLTSDMQNVRSLLSFNCDDIDESGEEQKETRIEEKRAEIRKKAFMSKGKDSTDEGIKSTKIRKKYHYEDKRLKRNTQNCSKIINEVLPQNLLDELELQETKVDAQDLQPILDLDADFESAVEVMRIDSIEFLENFMFDIENVETLSDLQFQAAFRMKRSTFDELVKIYEVSEQFKNFESSSSSESSPQVDIYMFLWYAGHQDTIGQVALVFNRQIRQTSRKIASVAEFFWSIKDDWISLPKNKIQIQHCVEEFEKITGCPRIFGFMYATNFRVLNKVDSLGMQGVFDARKRFRRIYFNEDVEINSELEFITEEIMDVNIKENDFQSMLARRTKKHYVLKPFVKDENLTEMQKAYNELYLAARHLYNDVFDVLITRFPQLHCFELTIDIAKKFITSCCVLYNYCIDNDDLLDEWMNHVAVVESDHEYVGCNKANRTRDLIVEELARKGCDESVEEDDTSNLESIQKMEDINLEIES